MKYSLCRHLGHWSGYTVRLDHSFWQLGQVTESPILGVMLYLPTLVVIVAVFGVVVAFEAPCMVLRRILSSDPDFVATGQGEPVYLAHHHLCCFVDNCLFRIIARCHYSSFSC